MYNDTIHPLHKFKCTIFFENFALKCCKYVTFTEKIVVLHYSILYISMPFNSKKLCGFYSSEKNKKPLGMEVSSPFLIHLNAMTTLKRICGK